MSAGPTNSSGLTSLRGSNPRLPDSAMLERGTAAVDVLVGGEARGCPCARSRPPNHPKGVGAELHSPAPSFYIVGLSVLRTPAPRASPDPAAMNPGCCLDSGSTSGEQ